MREKGDLMITSWVQGMDRLLSQPAILILVIWFVTR